MDSRVHGTRVDTKTKVDNETFTNWYVIEVLLMNIICDLLVWPRNLPFSTDTTRHVLHMMCICISRVDFVTMSDQNASHQRFSSYQHEDFLGFWNPSSLQRDLLETLWHAQVR